MYLMEVSMLLWVVPLWFKIVQVVCKQSAECYTVIKTVV